MGPRKFCRILVVLMVFLALLLCGCDGFGTRPNLTLQRTFLELPEPSAFSSPDFNKRMTGYTKTQRHRSRSVRLLFNGEQLFPYLFADIRAARKEVYLTTFTFYCDSLGMKLADLLMQKAREGLDVRFVFDSFGSYYPQNSEKISEMRRAGVKVQPFNPILGATIIRFNNRCHAKMAAIDGEISYVMGLNFSRKYLGGGLTWKTWRDTGIRAVGSVTKDVRSAFLEIFKESGRGLIGKKLPLPFVDLLAEKVGKMLGQETYWPPKEDNAVNDEGDGTPIRVILSRPGWFSQELYNALLFAIQSSRKSIDIECGYFLPDRVLTKALRSAADRGVKIRIILPDRLDVYLSKKCSLEVVRGLVKKGISLYKYMPGLLHSKVVVIDGEWIFCGSSNINGRAFFMNYECNFTVLDEALAAQMRSQFDFDIMHCKVLKKDDLRYVNPLQFISHKGLLLLKDQL